MLTVTVTKHSTVGMKITGSCDSGKTIQTKYGSSHDCGELAALAVDMAKRHGSRGYAIFAPDAILALIPDELRCR